MKAEINGVKVEGAPDEIAQVIKAVGAVKSQETIKYVPVYYPSSPLERWIVTSKTTGGVTYEPTGVTIAYL